MDIKDFKGHIFDLDGTLTRSNHVWSKIDEEFLGKRGIKCLRIISSRCLQ